MNVVAAGLLDINVLPRLSRPDRHERVPVIGCGDRDHVDILVVKHPANVLHSGRCAAAVRFDLMDALVSGTPPWSDRSRPIWTAPPPASPPGRPPTRPHPAGRPGTTRRGMPRPRLRGLPSHPVAG